MYTNISCLNHLFWQISWLIHKEFKDCNNFPITSKNCVRSFDFMFSRMTFLHYRILRYCWNISQWCLTKNITTYFLSKTISLNMDLELIAVRIYWWSLLDSQCLNTNHTKISSPICWSITVNHSSSSYLSRVFWDVLFLIHKEFGKGWGTNWGIKMFARGNGHR